LGQAITDLFAADLVVLIESGRSNLDLFDRNRGIEAQRLAGLLIRPGAWALGRAVPGDGR
jgi:hypothetical protein